jgi:hypothetical protein
LAARYSALKMKEELNSVLKKISWDFLKKKFQANLQFPAGF